MNYKDFNLGDWIGHISGVIEDESELDGNEMRDLAKFLTTLKQEPFFWEKCPYYEPDMMFDGKDEYDMGKCKYKQEPLTDVLDKIRAEIDRQYKWLINTRYTIHDVDIAFDSIFQTIEKCRKE